MIHASVVFSYIGLLCLGKRDFEAMNGFRKDTRFAEALSLAQVPSEGILHQRTNAIAVRSKPAGEAATVAFLRRSEARLTQFDNGLMSLDDAATPLDNSESNKERVSQTYKSIDGGSPMAAYPRQQRYFLELDLREGNQHCQKGTPAFLKADA